MAVEVTVPDSGCHGIHISVHKGHFTCMGGVGDSMFPGILQVPLQDSLSDSRRHTPVRDSRRTGVLTSILIFTMSDIIIMGTCGAVLIGTALFLYVILMKNKIREWKEKMEYAGWQTRRNYRAKLAYGSFGRQGRACRLRQKSSSLRCGIFAVSLALPEPHAVLPL